MSANGLTIASRLSYLSLSLHAVLVLPLAASLFASALGPPPPDADIGAAFVAMLLTVFGAPWSLVYLVLDGSARSLAYGSLIVAALVNLVVHAWFVYLLRKAAKVEAVSAR